jgi:uncharacterized protein
MATDDLSQLFARPVFEWDENKRVANVAKHRIDFADATEAFHDPTADCFLSPRPGGEQRYVIVGSMQGSLIAVVFTPRRDAIRIISARMARQTERQRYAAKAEKKKE